MSLAENAKKMPPIIDIQGLRKSYGSNEVLKGIDLKVKAGGQATHAL